MLKKRHEYEGLGRKDMVLKIDKKENRCWFNSKGDLHRLDGSAFEWGINIKHIG